MIIAIILAIVIIFLVIPFAVSSFGFLADIFADTWYERVNKKKPKA
jgi:hypothetical protein